MIICLFTEKDYNLKVLHVSTLFISLPNKRLLLKSHMLSYIPSTVWNWRTLTLGNPHAKVLRVHQRVYSPLLFCRTKTKYNWESIYRNKTIGRLEPTVFWISPIKQLTCISNMYHILNLYHLSLGMTPRITSWR